jgi:glycosyltransferase involved in cell wall biosynthesis
MPEDPSQQPTVLVVVPTLGERLETLEDSLASVRAQQGVETHLVVVVPETALHAREAAQRYGATLVDDPRSGLSGAVNAGIATRRDEDFYAWLGDDDLLLPGGLATLAGLLTRREDAVVAYGACPYIDDQGRTVAVSRAGGLATRIMGWGPNLLPQPASLTRLTALVAAGPYDESLKFAMDLDMFLRLKRSGAFISTKTEVAAFRWHPDSLTVANRDKSLAEAEMIKRRYLPVPLRRVAPGWELPVRWATRLAARQVGARSRKMADQGTGQR